MILQFLFYVTGFISLILCSVIYATLFNSFSNEQIFKAIQEQKLAEESLQSYVKLISLS